MTGPRRSLGSEQTWVSRSALDFNRIPLVLWLLRRQWTVGGDKGSTARAQAKDERDLNQHVAYSTVSGARWYGFRFQICHLLAV